MDLHELEYYIAIAEAENLSKAAEKVYVSQPALSQYLNKTERKLGIKLFRRLKNNSLELTDAGRLYLACCQDILNLWRKTQQDLVSLQQKESQQLSIGVVTQQAALQLSQILLDIQSLYPNLHINIQTELPSVLQEKVLQGELHIAFSAYHQEHPLLNYYNLARQEIELLVPDQHYLAKYSYQLPGQENSRIPLHDVGKEPLVLLSKNTILGQVEEEYFRQVNFHPNTMATVTHAESVQTFVASGNYLGLSPKRRISYNNVVPVALESPVYYQNGAIYRKDLFITNILNRIIKTFGECYWAVPTPTGHNK